MLDPWLVDHSLDCWGVGVLEAQGWQIVGLWLVLACGEEIGGIWACNEFVDRLELIGPNKKDYLGELKVECILQYEQTFSNR